MNMGVGVVVRHTLQSPFGWDLWLGPLLLAVLRHSPYKMEQTARYEYRVSHCAIIYSKLCLLYALHSFLAVCGTVGSLHEPLHSDERLHIVIVGIGERHIHL